MGLTPPSEEQPRIRMDRDFVMVTFARADDNGDAVIGSQVLIGTEWAAVPVGTVLEAMTRPIAGHEDNRYRIKIENLVAFSHGKREMQPIADAVRQTLVAYGVTAPDDAAEDLVTALLSAVARSLAYRPGPDAVPAVKATPFRVGSRVRYEARTWTVNRVRPHKRTLDLITAGAGRPKVPFADVELLPDRDPR